MALTALDPKTAFVAIDLQNGIVGRPTVHPIGPVIDNAAALAAAFRERGLPVALVNVTGVAPGRTEAPRMGGSFPPGFADLVPQLNPQPGDHLATKRTWGAFASTDLDAWLKAQGATQVVLAGVSTSIGVETTAREAYALGYNVTLAVDAMTDMAAEAHDNSVRLIFPRLGESGTTQDVLALLAGS